MSKSTTTVTTAPAARAHEIYLADFARVETNLPGAHTTWLPRLRKEALARFAQTGFPTPRDEAWKYTNVAEIARTRFEPAKKDAASSLTAQDLAPFALPGFDGARAVFVDGRHAPHLSSGTLPDGARVQSLASAIAQQPDAVEAHLGRHATVETTPFVALNTALFEDGAFIHVAPGVVSEKPIHLIFLSTAGGSAPSASHPRNLVVVGENAQATVIETYAGLATSAPYLTNAVTELVAGENAVVEHVKIQQESPGAFHVAALHTTQGRASAIQQHNVSLGARLARNDLSGILNGEGADLVLNGLFVGAGAQHVDNHTRVDHAKPHCTSREVYKGVLDQQARGVFHGRILVREGAQKTDAKQTNKNLLLSNEALVDSTPQLEIYADDVKCTHGSTIGQLEDAQTFYLRARGIGAARARQMLTLAFAADIVNEIRAQPAREAVHAWLAQHLATGHLATEASA